MKSRRRASNSKYYIGQTIKHKMADTICPVSLSAHSFCHLECQLLNVAIEREIRYREILEFILCNLTTAPHT